MNIPILVTCPRGIEYLLEEELRAWPLTITHVNPQGVYAEASLEVVYDICLWSRLANRVQWILFSGTASNQASVYALCHAFAWETVFTVDKSLSVEFHGSNAHLRNSMFGAQVVKDAVVDYFRQQSGIRPAVDRADPDIRIHAHLKNDVLTVSADLVGYSLHQRGYRLRAGEAPLKENIAAAMLMRAGWLNVATEGGDFMDPFCGSGTLVIEAAMMAARMAPGLLRQDQAIQHYNIHDSVVWEEVRQRARTASTPCSQMIVGSDQDANIIAIAKENAARAGVSSLVRFSVIAIEDSRPLRNNSGLLVTNPPYGERLSDPMALMPLYQALGRVLHTYYQGWHALVLALYPLLAKGIGLRAYKQYAIANGPLACQLYCIRLDTQNQYRDSAHPASPSDGAHMFANRLKKNTTHLSKWLKRTGTSAYRVYDADLPEYAYAIDIYNDYAVLQEYAAPRTIPTHVVERRSLDVIQTVPRVLGLAPDHLIIKQRKAQRGTQQYEKLNQIRQRIEVYEGQAKFYVNLHDYIDTGLFLDHRLLRLKFGTLSPGIRFLNCFCYTASASVHAAMAGAWTTNVDLSNTYLRWAEDNFLLNKLDTSRHQFVQYDCCEWLQHTRDTFDVIFLDPPSFSNSKRMETTLDIQRDHVMLIRAAARLLNPKGVLYFSTNLRGFKLAATLVEEYAIRDITLDTIDIDFQRNQKIHQCFEVRRA